MKVVEIIAVERNHDYGEYPLVDTFIIGAEDSVNEEDVPNLLCKALTEVTGREAGEYDDDDTDNIVYFGRDLNSVPDHIMKKYGLSFLKHKTIQVAWEDGDKMNIRNWNTN